MTRSTLPSLADVDSWPGATVHDRDGTGLGTCRSVYADDSTGMPEWVEVTLTDDTTAFVPTLGATADGDVVTLAQPAKLVAGSPRFPTDASLEPADERALYAHYGLEVSAELSDTLLPAAATPTPTAAPTPTPAPAAPPVTAPTPAPPLPAYTAAGPTSSAAPFPATQAGLAVAAVGVAAALLVVRRRRKRRSWR